MNFFAKIRLCFNKALLAAFLITVVIISSCKPEKKKIDVSQVNLNLQVQRLEEDVPSHVDDVAFLQNKYGSFWQLFIYKLVQIGTTDTVLLKTRLNDFVHDADITNVYADSKKLYSDFTPENQQLTDAFRHYKYYFPNKIIPEVITFISGFNYGIVAVDSALGIGVDMYLGDTVRYYPGLNLPQFKIRRMRREYIAVDAMKSWLQTEWEEDPMQTDLLSQMMYQGKILYTLNAMMPDTPDSVKTGYTAKQLKWCEENEKNVWSFFIEHSLLFSSDQVQLSKYIGEGPTTNGFPKESPGNIGLWIGWRIITDYMKERPQTSLPQLLNDNDYKKIFSDSKYKPGK